MKRWIVILLIAVPILGIGAYLVWSQLSGAGDDADAAVDLSLKTVTVERGNIQVMIDATGTIEPLNIVTVNSKANGEILKLLVDEGDYVKKGDIIAEIETTYVQVDYDQAEADLAASQAKLDQATINVALQKEQIENQITQAQKSLDEAQTKFEQLAEQIRLEKQTNARSVASAKNDLKMAQMRFQLQTSEMVRSEDIKRAEASVTQAKVSRDLAQKEYDRKKPLFEKGYLSKAELDAEDAQLQSAEAQYQSALEQTKMVRQPASETQLQLAQAEIDKSQFALDAALEKVETEKYRDMELTMQENRVEQAKESLKLAETNRAQIQIKQKDLESAKASLTRSEVQLDLAKERLEDTKVTAPISGTILEKRVEKGQVITSTLSSAASSEGTTLVTMADLSKVYVVTEVDETDIGKVQIGQSVTITVEAYSEQPFEGEVLKIAPQGQVIQNITTFDVTTELKNVRSSQGQQDVSGMPGEGAMGGQRMGNRRPQGDTPTSGMNRPEQVATADTGNSSDDFFDAFFDQGGFEAVFAAEESAQQEEQASEDSTAPFLKPGMNATVEIWIADKQNVLLVPNEAILAFGARKMVRLVGEDGQPGRPQPVTTGVSSFDKTEILSGVEEGQVISLGGLQRSGGPGEEFRRMMQNPSSTMRRMQRNGGPGGGPPPR